jgi:two-component system sensor histidine kinase YesM
LSLFIGVFLLLGGVIAAVSSAVITADIRRNAEGALTLSDANLSTAIARIENFDGEIPLGEIDGIKTFVFGSNNTSKYYIIRDDGFVLLSSDDNIQGKFLVLGDFFRGLKPPFRAKTVFDGEKASLLVRNAEKTSAVAGGTYYAASMQKNSVAYRDLYVLIGTLSGIFGGVLLLGVALITVLSRRITLPITALNDGIKGYIESGADTKIETNDSDELSELSLSYEKLVERIKELLSQQKTQAEEQRKLELDILQVQINPHFLYNSLDAIAWMAKIRRADEIETLAIDLARFFRLSLHKGDKFITVAEELEIVKNFIDIEKTRLPGKFEAVYEIDDSVLNYSCLKLILQPLVENAIKHGIAASEKTANLLTVRARSEGDDIVFEVIDDGAGFAPDESGAGHGAKTKGGGYGIKNVSARLQLEYGGGYGLATVSELGKGTAVTVKIPKKN